MACLLHFQSGIPTLANGSDYRAKAAGSRNPRIEAGCASSHVLKEFFILSHQTPPAFVKSGQTIMSISSVSGIAASSLAQQAQSQSQLALASATAAPTATPQQSAPTHHHHGGGERTPAQSATQAPTGTANVTGGINTVA
jgi:hypothetical protein